MADRLQKLAVAITPDLTIDIGELDSDVTAQTLVNAVATKLALPMGTTASLIRKETKQQIPLWQTLREAGVRDGEILEVSFERIAGSGTDTSIRGNKFPTHSVYRKLRNTPPHDILKFEFHPPYISTINDFFGEVTSKVKAIDYIYSVFALLTSGDSNTINRYLLTQKERQSVKQSDDLEQSLEHVLDIKSHLVRAISLKRFLSQANVEPLRVVSVHYGSPASFDLLGIGKILEIIRDTSKDLIWLGKHEKEMAELERKNKHVEIQRAKLENKKKSFEIINQQQEIEKAGVEIAIKKLELIEKINGLELSESDKQMVASALLPKMNTLSKGLVMPLLQSENETKLPPNIGNEK